MAFKAFVKCLVPFTMTRPLKDSYKVSYSCPPLVRPLLHSIARASQTVTKLYSLSKDASTIPQTAAQAQKWITMYRVSNPRASHCMALIKRREGLDNPLVKGCIVVCNDNQKYKWKRFAYHLKCEDVEIKLKLYASPPRRSSIQAAIGDVASNPCHV